MSLIVKSAHAGAVEWMGFAGCSLTVYRVTIFIAVIFFAYSVLLVYLSVNLSWSYSKYLDEGIVVLVVAAFLVH